VTANDCCDPAHAVCNNGVTTTCCMGPGGACQAFTECCSNTCNPDHTCGCIPVASFCTTSSECCNGAMCPGNACCYPSGHACTQNNECCNGCKPNGTCM
jgi:hypothetical protein